MMKKDFIILTFEDSQLKVQTTNNFHYDKNIVINNIDYGIMTDEKGIFLGFIDWFIDDKFNLRKIVISPIDEYDDLFSSFYIKNDKCSNIKYEKEGLFEIIFDIQLDEEDISEEHSEFQTFLFSGFLTSEDQIIGLIFNISDFRFEIPPDSPPVH